MLRSPLRSVLNSPLSSAFDRRPTALTISQLLPSGAGRVAAIYSDPARPSYDECIQKNVAAIAAGRPQDCVLFADAAGQTPVVYPIGAGQGKGLLLDRSAGLALGSEIIVNGGFDTDTDWTKGVGATISGGVLSLSTELTAEMATQDVGISSAKWLRVTLTVNQVSGNYRVFVAGAIVLTTGNGSGTFTRTVLATGAETTFRFRAEGGFVGTVDNISVRELPGHHQQQPTAAARGEFQAPVSATHWRSQTDDWAKTRISPSGATKAIVWLSLKKINNTAAAVLAEFGPNANSTAGTFSIEGPATGGANEIVLRVRGASGGTTVTGALAAGTAAVIRAEIDLASQTQELFINGVSQGVSTATIGATVFAAQDFFTASRNGAGSFVPADWYAPELVMFMQPGDAGPSASVKAKLDRAYAKAAGVTL